MTYREKLEKELPEHIRPGAIAGIKGCPHNYFNIPDNVKPCAIHQTVNNDICSACWDREIPTPTSAEVRYNIELGKELAEGLDEAFGTCGIKDSGERRQFETGAVRDIQEGKGRCDLMPLRVVAKAYDQLKDDLGHNGEVVRCIAAFQETGETTYLYHAMDLFDCFGGSWSTMFLEVAKHFEEGAKKYGENNWQKGLPVNCYIDSAVRHYLKWLRGDKDEPHDRAFVWNLMCCIWEADFSPRAKAEAQEPAMEDIPQKDDSEESVMDIHVESAWIRLGNCPCGLIEIDGAVYVKTAALVSKTSAIAVANVTNGVMTALHPDIYARPLKAVMQEDYNRAWNQTGK